MLEGRVAVVTGCARVTGIGHACCLALLRRGAYVIGIDSSPLAATSPLLSSRTAPKRLKALEHFHFVQASIVDDATTLSRGIVDALQGLEQEEIHVVVNNAGFPDASMPPFTVSGSGSTDQSNAAARIARFGDFLSVNLAGAFTVTEVCRPFFPVMRRSKSDRQADRIGTPRSSRLLASVIHISSTRAKQSEPHSEGYAAAKAGLLGLTHAQSSSLAGIARVNAVLPGWIDTADRAGADASGSDSSGLQDQSSGLEPGTASEFEAKGWSDEVTFEDHEWHDVKRVGLPEDVANMVAFLADPDAAGFVTGGEFVVDGGVSRRMVYPEGDN